MKTIINKSNKTTVIRSIAIDMEVGKNSVFVVEKDGVDVYEIVGIMKTKQTQSGFAFKAKKFATKSTFAWTIESGETVTQKYSEAAEVASQNKYKKLVTYFK